MMNRAPRYAEAELHDLIDGCIKRWDVLVLRSNINTDLIDQNKEAACKAIEGQWMLCIVVNFFSTVDRFEKKAAGWTAKCKRETARDPQETQFDWKSRVPYLSDFDEEVGSLIF